MIGYESNLPDHENSVLGNEDNDFVIGYENNI